MESGIVFSDNNATVAHVGLFPIIVTKIKRVTPLVLGPDLTNVLRARTRRPTSYMGQK